MPGFTAKSKEELFGMKHAVYAQIEKDFEEHVENVREAVRRPSISADGTGIEEMALWLRDKISSLGAQCRLEPTGGHPMVYGYLDAGASRTVLFYDLYDVQPVQKDGWVAPPFSGDILDFNGLGPCLIGRGSFNSKGCIMGMLNALDSFLKCGENIPVNVLFMIEGEEEIGSPNLPNFIKSHLDELRKADCVFWPYFGENRTGTTTVKLGSKGLVYLELICEGGNWGGPVKRDIHPKHAGWIASPAMELARALATLTDKSGALAIDGALEQVRPISEGDLALLDSLSASFDPETVLKEEGARSFSFHPNSKRELLARHILSPSLNIDGLVGGYTGEGSNTIMPRSAKAKIDIRLVPDMTPDTLLKCLRTHLDRRGFPHIKIEVLSAYPPSRSDSKNPYITALLDSVRQFAPGPVQVWPIDPGCGPEYLFTEVIGIPIAFGGLGYGGNPHSVNEFIQVNSLIRNEKANAAFLLRVGAI